MIRGNIIRIASLACHGLALVACLLCLAGCTQLATSARSAAQTVQKQVIPDSLTASAKKLVDDPFSPHKPHPAVVRIMAVEANGVSFGSGTLIYRQNKMGLVVTNWHVVRDSPSEIIVTFPNGFRSSAKIAKGDAEWDLAALLVWTPDIEPVRITDTPPRPGDELTIAGYGSGVYRAVSGTCAQYVAPSLNKPHEMVELNAVARQGDSGGPILNTNGELAGVLFGASWRTTSGSYSGRVKTFLDPVIKKMQSPVNSTAKRKPDSIPTAPPVAPAPRTRSESIENVASSDVASSTPASAVQDSPKPSQTATDVTQPIPSAPALDEENRLVSEPATAADKANGKSINETLGETVNVPSPETSQADSIAATIDHQDAGLVTPESEPGIASKRNASAPIEQLDTIEIPDTTTTERVVIQPESPVKEIPPFELDKSHLWEKVQLAKVDAVGLPVANGTIGDSASTQEESTEAEYIRSREQLSDNSEERTDQVTESPAVDELIVELTEFDTGDYQQVHLSDLTGDSPLSNAKLLLYMIGFLVVVVQLARRRD
tara:strand:+ start:72 stop:1709 length:1638 start_codon:yes stop_codon:yes gene_type:complete